jgi:hypothetical protein
MKSNNTVLNAIAALNLEPIKNKLMDAESGEGWSRAKVEAMDLEYRRFLHLMHAFPNQNASPTKAVDTFWHYHILDTQRYAADCDAVFGCFMHHNPYAEEETAASGEGDGVDSGERMRQMYEATFGEAYIRKEVYCLDLEPDAPAMAGGLAGAKSAVCHCFCMMQPMPKSAKAAVCHSFCMAQAKPASAKTAVCHCFCMMATGDTGNTGKETTGEGRPVARQNASATAIAFA